MAHVVFAFGSKPGLSERQALEVAEALSVRRSTAAQSAAKKIRHQARVNVDAGELSEDVVLEREELAELASVMTQVSWPDDEPAYEHLRREVSSVA
ncbi:MAG TPA: hypothetical protein VFU30_13205 [Gaiellaceae bacterium]|nr:hypothetical protein [Gaiellaceae bacterium]